MLPKKLFKLVLENLPIFSIDIILLNEKQEILLGKRNNPPAKDFWFVPGGRVLKNESLARAFNRIAINELGTELEYNKATILYVFDHFYSNSVISNNISTHYINAPHVIETNISLNTLPDIQHSEYRWVAISQFELDKEIHPNSKVFLRELERYLGNNDD